MGIDEDNTTKDFINQSYLEVKIKEVFKEFSNNFSTNLDRKVKNLVAREFSYLNADFVIGDPNVNRQHERISSLEEDITFLRGEILCKNKIIDILLSEKKITQTAHINQKQENYLNEQENFAFEFPKRYIKKSFAVNKNEKSFLSKNFYDVLVADDDEDNDDIYNSINESNVNKNSAIPLGLSHTKNKIKSQLSNVRKSLHKTYLKKKKFDTLNNINNINDLTKNNVIEPTEGIKDFNSNITVRKKKLNRKEIKTNKENNNYHDITESFERSKNKNIVAIVGDSMLKNVQGFKLSNNENRVVVKSFSGAKTTCMLDYIKPSITRKPNMIIIHCGTNDLKDNQHQILENVNELVNVVARSSSDTQIVISGVISRNDNLNTKINAINDELKRLCNERNLRFIDNCNINRKEHLNKSRIHLNRKGTEIFTENLRGMISN